MITKEVIVQEDELKILREFMRSKAGRTLDIRTIEGALILGILSQITHENSTTQHEERMAFGG
jgi:hypothetical protein